jgi:hypothetical protein
MTFAIDRLEIASDELVRNLVGIAVRLPQQPARVPYVGCAPAPDV